MSIVGESLLGSPGSRSPLVTNLTNLALKTDSTYFPGDRNGSFLSASTHDSGTYGYPCRMSSSACSVDIFSAAFHCCHFAHSFWRASSMPFCCSSSALLRSFPEASFLFFEIPFFFLHPFAELVSARVAMNALYACLTAQRSSIAGVNTSKFLGCL